MLRSWNHLRRLMRFLACLRLDMDIFCGLYYSWWHYPAANWTKSISKIFPMQPSKSPNALNFKEHALPSLHVYTRIFFFETKSSHLKIGRFPKGKDHHLPQPSIFRCYVSFREGNIHRSFWRINTPSSVAWSSYQPWKWRNSLPRRGRRIPTYPGNLPYLEDGLPLSK